ncbi:MAG: AAA family ATPase, partial [Desulfuromonadaceae bacterium]|nr:AAA family ATPase [Desulfuromonadaceae bacterium]
AGFILLAGEVGSGKTTLIRNLINDLDEDIALCRVFNTRADAAQILAMINEDFGLEVEGKDKVALLRDLNDHLVVLHAEGRRALIIIDEAQNLSVEVLEEIRLLSNLEADTVKLVQIILVGQPELVELIIRPELRQLRQRIGIHCQLEPLTREEVEGYIYHRLETAGNREAVIWHAGAFDLMYHYSGGVPRLINQFCDFALLCVFAEQGRELSLEMLKEVIGDITWDKTGSTGEAGGAIYPTPQQNVSDWQQLADFLTRIERVWGEDGAVLAHLETREERTLRLELHQMQLKQMQRIDILLERIAEHLGAPSASSISQEREN